jgi:hypothetical protein
MTHDKPTSARARAKDECHYLPEMPRRLRTAEVHRKKQREEMGPRGSRNGSRMTPRKRSSKAASFEASCSGYERCWMLQPPQIPKWRQTAVAALSGMPT